MPKTLVIVESPAKARTIERFLKTGYEVLASYGHVRDLPESADEIPKAPRVLRCCRAAFGLVHYRTHFGLA